VQINPAREEKQIRLLSFFSCFKLGVGGPVYFLIDTGASRSLLSERDARILGIDYGRLELQKEPLVGLGGTLPVYKTPGECSLTFRTSEQKGHVESFPHFDVVRVEIEDEKKRRLVFNLIPSLIGMDLLPRFKFYATRDVAYLER